MAQKKTGRASFLAEVARCWPVAKGSIAEVRKPCIRRGCPACARGDRHPALIFSFLEQGRRRCLYVPRDLAPLVRQAIANGRKIEQILLQAGAELIRSERVARRRGKPNRSRE